MNYIHLEYLRKTKNLKITYAKVSPWGKEPMVHISLEFRWGGQIRSESNHEDKILSHTFNCLLATIND